ncbi:Translationally-controlled tumor protein [Lemmus lemmus]
MIICWDLISHSKLFSTSTRSRRTRMSCAWGMEGKVLTVEAEGTESTVVICAEIVRSHHLQEASFTKGASKKMHQRLHEIIQRQT